MKIKLIITSVMLSFMMMTNAQEGAISKSMLQNYRKEIKNNEKIKVLQNAVTNNDILKLGLNYGNDINIDTYFSHRVKTKGITDQKSSGRCWLFTGLNVLRAKTIEAHNLGSFQFSQAYNFFYDQLEKSNLFLEGIIKTADKPMDDKRVEWLLKHPIGDGGQWTGVSDLIKKYGVVPASVMPETHSSKNTRWMQKLIKKRLRKGALVIREKKKANASLADLRSEKENILADIYKILVINLGEPPMEFQWRYKDADGNLTPLKTYTPQSFYETFVGSNLSDYVMIMNDPSRPYNKLYEIDYDRHMYDGHNWKYVNLEADEIKKFAIASIKANEGMYFSCDVGKQLNRENGVLDVNNYDFMSLVDVDFSMDKKERVMTFDSGSSHGMTLMGVDLDENGNPKKWLLENSWGPSSGFEGHLIMTDKWFDEYMFRLVVDKKYVSKKVLDILKQKPTMLPPWDPMF